MSLTGQNPQIEQKQPTTTHASEHKMEVILLPAYYPKNMPLGGLFCQDEQDEMQEKQKEEKRKTYEVAVFRKKPTKTIMCTNFGIFAKPKDKIKSNLLGVGQIDGNGIQTRVKVVEEKGTGILYAVKIQPATAEATLSAAKEAKVLKNLQRLKGQVLRHSPSKGIQQIYTFMQLLPGKILWHWADEINFQKLWNVSLRRRIMMCLAVLTAVREFHNLGYWHRDLKLENIFYDFTSGKAFVSDFETATKKEKYDGGIYGTAFYKAPDIGPHFCEGFEVYALGKTLAALLCCYRDQNQDPLTLEDLQKFRQDPNRNYTGITNLDFLEKIIILLNRMTDPKNENRPSLKDCITEILQIWYKRACEVSLEIVYFLNVAQFFKATTAEEINVLFAQLKRVHEVCLLDTSAQGYTTEQMRQLQREMSAHHVILHDKMYRKPGVESRKLANEIIQQFQEQGRSDVYTVLPEQNASDLSLLDIVVLTPTEFTARHEKIHRHLLIQLEQRKISVDEVVKLYHARCKLHTDPTTHTPHTASVYPWVNSTFHVILRLCLERYKELSSNGRKQLNELLNGTGALFDRYKKRGDFTHWAVMTELKMAYNLVRLANGLPPLHNDLFTAGTFQELDIQQMLHYAKDTQGAKELLKFTKNFHCTPNSKISSLIEDISQLGHLKAYLPAKVIMSLLSWNFGHAEKSSQTSQALFDLVMTKPKTPESKSESVREGKEEENTLSQELATALINDNQGYLVGHLNLEHAALVFEQATGTAASKAKILKEDGIRMVHGPLISAYLLKAQGHDEPLAKILENARAVTTGLPILDKEIPYPSGSPISQMPAQTDSSSTSQESSQVASLRP